jgi:hypothetical protein
MPVSWTEKVRFDPALSTCTSTPPLAVNFDGVVDQIGKDLPEASFVAGHVSFSFSFHSLKLPAGDQQQLPAGCLQPLQGGGGGVLQNAVFGQGAIVIGGQRPQSAHPLLPSGAFPLFGT